MSELVIEIRVRPNSSGNKVGGSAGDPPRLVVAVQAPAVDGKANEAVIKELAKALGLKPHDLAIVSGELSRDKRVSINPVSAGSPEWYTEITRELNLLRSRF